MSEVRIRPLEERDIARSVEIESAILGSKRSATLRGSLTAYLAKGDRNACLAAEMDGTLVGFLIGEVRTWDFGEDQEVGWIKIVGIDPAHQGKGIGKALGEALLKYFQEREIRTVRTAVDWDAADMIAYFRSLGFERSGHIGLEKELD